MSTFTNSEDPDEMPGTSLFAKVKKIFRQKCKFFLKNYNLAPIDNLICPKFILLDQKEESISIQRVLKSLCTWVIMYYYLPDWSQFKP